MEGLNLSWWLAPLLTLIPAVVFADTRPVPFSAEMVTAQQGVTTRSHVWSDGVHRRVERDDGGGAYFDEAEKQWWRWGADAECRQEPLDSEAGTLDSESGTQVEEVGSETVDGHPTRKYKLSPAQPGFLTTYEWRAVDLGDLVIQRRSADGQYEMHLRNIVLGKPDPKLLVFPSAQCRHEAPSAMAERQAKAVDATVPQTPGGYRTISFFDAACKRLVPLPLVMSIPSDYAIHFGGVLRGCFWGAAEDLDRVLATQEGVDFDSIRRGVFSCRASTDTVFDPVHEKFVSAEGPQERWPETLKALGVQDLAMTPKRVGGIPTLRVSGGFGGQQVYMLYLGFGDSPAILISYRPAGKGGAADHAAWQRFLDSLQPAN